MIEQENVSSQSASKLKSNSTKVALPSQITLIDGQQQSMRDLAAAIQDEGYSTRLFFDIDEALRHMAKTNLILIDATVANQPKSSKLINIPTLLVLSNDSQAELPPWLEARHVFLVPYPTTPDELIACLPDYLAPSPPKFDFMLSNSSHLTLLFGINQTLSGHFLDIQDLFERVLALTPYLNADFAALLVQEGDDTIFYRSTQPGREELLGPAGRRFAQRLLKDGIEGWALQHEQAVLLPNTTTDSRWFRAPYLPEDECCVVVLPVTLERVDACGVYLVGSTQSEYYDNEDLPLFSAVAAQIGTSIENAMLFKNQSERSIQLSLMNEVGQAATSILNLDAMLRTVVQAIHRSFSFYNVTIHLYNPTTELIELRASALMENSSLVLSTENRQNTHQLDQGLVGWTMANNKTLLVNDVTHDKRYIFNRSNREIRSELCVPITMGTKTIGVLNLQSTQLEAFDKYHVSALETLGDQLAIAIENARLYEAQKSTINRLEETQKQLVQSGKLAAVGELAAGVAHEINNPLTTIIALTHLLIDTPGLEPYIEDLQMVHAESQRAREIVHHLLDFARTDTPKRQLVDLNQIIEEAISLVYTKSLSEKIEIQVNLNPLPELSLDVNQIKQVFVNLLNNALQAMMDKGGSTPTMLAITTQLFPAEALGESGVASEWQANQDIVTCIIRDTGCGIALEYLDKIFDPFFTTKEVGQGTGLGLSISYGILKKHGGDITVESALGQGTVFTITLPLSAP